MILNFEQMCFKHIYIEGGVYSALTISVKKLLELGRKTCLRFSEGALDAIRRLVTPLIINGSQIHLILAGADNEMFGRFNTKEDIDD